jgi:hypothetical protein
MRSMLSRLVASVCLTVSSMSLITPNSASAGDEHMGLRADDPSSPQRGIRPAVAALAAPI